jgi:SAM-dependent methyltransferase
MPSEAPAPSYGDALMNWMWHWGGPGLDSSVSKYRKRQLADVSGDTLEIGSGHGHTLAYLDANLVKITCIEPNIAMLYQLKVNAAKVGFSQDKNNLRVIGAPAEAFSEAPENGFDTVISSFTLCSVSDEVGVLRNIGKWLRPGGIFLFQEHSGDALGTWRRSYQEWLTPAWKVVGGGCCLDRDHVKLIEEVKDEHGNSLFSSVTWEEIGVGKRDKWGPAWLTKPLIMGKAVKA